MKKIITLLLVLATLLIVVPAAYASPCCELYIESIAQNDDIVTVNYGYMNNNVPNREILLTVTQQNSWRVEVTESHFVNEWNGRGSFSFSSTDFLNGTTYTVKVYYTSRCDNYHCDYSIGETVNITIEGGKPVFKFEELINGKLEPVGASSAYLSVTANASGFYSLSAVTYEGEDSYNDWEIDFRTYPNNTYVSSDSITYMKAGQSDVYLISNRFGDDLSTNIVFERHEPIVFAPLTTNLQNPAKVFSLSEVKGIGEITIPKYGLYDFSVSGGEENDNGYTIMNADGNTIEYAYGDLKKVLRPGTYYINTKDLAHNYTLDITYTVPEAVEAGKDYTLAPDEKAVFKMNVTVPSVVTFEGYGAIVENENNAYSFYDGEKTNVITPGEYLVNVENYSEEDSVWSFDMQQMPSIPIGVSSKIQIEAGYKKYIAFCAPEDGKYEFDFSKCSDYNIETSDEYTSVDYYAIEMKKDEWFMVSVYTDDSEITVRKYVEPTEIALEFDRAEYFDYCSGKTYLYSYTPTEDGDFKFVSSNNYCGNIKIYTDSEVLYNTSAAEWNFSKIVKLQKNVKVYIELSGRSTAMGDVAQNDIKVTGAFTELTNGTAISLSSSEDLTMCYTVPEEGFYDVLLSSQSGNWYGAEVKINEEPSQYVYSSSPLKKAIHCSAGEKIYFTFYKYTGSWCNVTVNISKISTVAIEEEAESELEANAYYSFTPLKTGLYRIDRDTYFGNIKIMDKRGINISFGTPDAVYFNGEEGVTYVLMPYEKMTAKISLDNAIPVTLGEKYNAGAEVMTFSFDVPESGYYKIDTSNCNSEIYVWCGDFWGKVSDTYYYMHKLDEGIFPIMYLPEQNNETGTPSSAQFTVTKCENSEKLGVSVDDLFMTFSYDGTDATVRLTVTAPYETEDIKVGVDYSGAGLEGSRTVANPEMRFTDRQYIQAMLDELEDGRTYTIKPFVYVGDDFENKIYGEEKTFTLKMRTDIKKIKSNSYKFRVEGRDKYNQYQKEYIFEFTQPENLTGEAEINYSVLSNVNIFNEYGVQIDFEWTDNGKKVMLTGGKKYYLAAGTYSDGIAEINITSLPEAEEASPYSVEIGLNTTNEIVCSVNGSGAEEPALYAAFYKGKKLVGIRMIENPENEEKVAIDTALGADSCKILLADNVGFVPLCENEELSLN